MLLPTGTTPGGLRTRRGLGGQLRSGRGTEGWRENRGGGRHLVHWVLVISRKT